MGQTSFENFIIKRLGFLICIILVIFVTSGCIGVERAVTKENVKIKEDITMWVYPLGHLVNRDTQEEILKEFYKKYPEIHVDVEFLDYTTGDEMVEAAILEGTAPDIIMEGPERIVANWAKKGYMADISDLWNDQLKANIDSQIGSAVEIACKNEEDIYYEYPLAATAHCMAINYDVFEKAGALKFLDLKHRTWTVEGFQKACKAIKESGLVKSPGVIYCGGQAGDQGTRALVTNFYGSSFTNKLHTKYTIDDHKGIKALKTLKKMTEEGLLSYNSRIQGLEEINMFANQQTAMTFAWNSSNEEVYVKDIDFKPYTMAFPTDTGKPSLCSGIWGFGIIDKGSEAKIKAAKTFIKFLCDDPVQGSKTVVASHVFPVRSSQRNAYKDTKYEAKMKPYQEMMKYVSDYYNITPGWGFQRTLWWSMLQQIFSGISEVEHAAHKYVNLANDVALDYRKLNILRPAESKSANRVLFISSYSISYPSIEEQIDGIRSGLGEDAYLHYEFMDSTSANGIEYEKDFYEYIKAKYERIGGVGVVILGGDNALQMAIRYQDGFFGNKKLVYEAINSRNLIDLAESLEMKGIITTNTVAENLALAKKLNPEAKKVCVIFDDTPTGLALSATALAVKKEYEPIEIELFNTSLHTKEEIIEHCAGLSFNEVTLCMLFTKDSQGNVYRYDQAVKLISENCKGPVLTLSWMGHGSLGSISIDNMLLGKKVGQLAEKVLNREPIDSTNYEGSTFVGKAYFDAEVMNNHHIDKNKLPSSAIYYNDIDESTRLMLVIVALFFIALFMSLLVRWYHQASVISKKRAGLLKEKSDILKTQAHIDALTGLGNRRLLDLELSKSLVSDRKFSLFLMDVDHFKEINDNFGHLIGDVILKEVGRRLSSIQERTFVPYRYGGDEFAMIYFHREDGGIDCTIDSKMAEVLALFEEEFCVDDINVKVSVSIGSVDFPEDAEDEKTLIKKADEALYFTKKNGRNGATRFKNIPPDGIGIEFLDEIRWL